MVMKLRGVVTLTASRAVACLGSLVLGVSAAAPVARQAPPAADLIDVRGTARAAGRPVSNVAVWLDAPNAPRSRTPKAVLDQRNLTFSPRVLVVRAGTTVDFPNSDRVFHNVFSFRDGTRFDLGMYPVGTTKPVVFDKPGLSRLFCNIHPNMAAYVMVVDSPYFGISDESGAFSLPDVPPNRYTYHAWRAGAPELSGQWTAEASDTRLPVEWP